MYRLATAVLLVGTTVCCSSDSKSGNSRAQVSQSGATNGKASPGPTGAADATAPDSKGSTTASSSPNPAAPAPSSTPPQAPPAPASPPAVAAGSTTPASASPSPPAAPSPANTSTPMTPGSVGSVDISFEVHANQQVHAISPYVYGLNDTAHAAAVRATSVRLGGNRLTAFNWENNASNAGSDYLYENDDFMCSGAGCSTPGQALKLFVDAAVVANASALITVPIVDFVAADLGPGGDVRNSGSNYLTTRFKQNNPTKGASFSLSPNATDASVYQDEMVNWVQTKYPTTNIMYMLDNEPDLWSSTHAEIHPTPVTYAELAQRTIQYATAIKAVAPNALVWGPASYGWSGYTNLQNATDANNRDFLEFYLDQLKAAEASTGKRTVDGIDLHWYPEATDGSTRITDTGSTSTLVTAREAAPRSLWDSTYKENSWITQYSTLGPINLIPRIFAKIAAHYPGTKLSFSEWNYGGGGTISGAIATADVLGIFGRDGVTMAQMWPLNSDESYTYAAFSAFRNYDGHGKAFADTSVSATTSDTSNSSVYGSTDSSNPARTVIVAINKAGSSKVAGLRVFHPTAYTTAHVYTVSATGGATVVGGTALAASATNAFKYTMPAQSITVIELTP